MKISIFTIALFSIFVMAVMPVRAMDDMPMSMPMSGESHQDIEGKGRVVSADKSAGEITLKHGPIPAIHWSAMTMSFKVKDRSLLDKVKVGDEVHFTLIPAGDDYIVTSIK